MYNCNLDIDSEDKRPASFINNENLGEMSNNVLPPNIDLACISCAISAAMASN